MLKKVITQFSFKLFPISILNAFFVLILFSTSCSTAKPIKKYKRVNTKVITYKDNKKSDSIIIDNISDKNIRNAIVESDAVNKVLIKAKSYLGTRYRYGGAGLEGIDCSGFILGSYAVINRVLPRISRDQANEGIRIERSEVQSGDLIFFATGGGRRISHVAIVTENDDEGNFHFIHASSSSGVIISSITESYWGHKYVTARRIILTEKE